jgi:Asp-tRNA(Asn)/Glu-tRNA(Gln) amidotransferase A subunit family amidase
MQKGTITAGKAKVMIRTITRRRAPIRHISKKRYSKVVMNLQKKLATRRISKKVYQRRVIRWRRKIVITRRSYNIRMKKYRNQLKFKKISKVVYRRRVRQIRRRVTRRINVKTYYKKTGFLKKRYQKKQISRGIYLRKVYRLKKRAGLIKKSKNGKVCVKKKVMDNLLNCKNCKKTAAGIKKS